MLTWVLVVVAVLCLLSAWRSGRRRGTRLALLVALGIPAQAVIGGVTVLTDLNPWIVSFHFLVSMAIIGVCVVLLDELRDPERAAAPERLRRLAWLVLAAMWVVLYLGTVVTGSGPHSGDLDSRRTGLDPQVMSHAHASAVYVVLALTVGLLALARRSGAQRVVTAAAGLLLLELLQGVVGFVQYATDLPEVLVGLHMLGAALLSAAVTLVVLSTRGRDRAQESSGSSATATNSNDR
jgi:cytochrome c oxidase assembly protein subunit 15